MTRRIGRLRLLVGWVAAVAIGGAALTTTSASAAPATFVFRGMGWGHAVGLSQYGALEQSKDGRSYRTILSTYYRGTSIGSNDVPSAVRVLLAAAVPQVSVEASSRFSFKSNGAEVAASPGSDGRWVVRVQPAGQFTIYRPDGLPAAPPVSASRPLNIEYEQWSTVLKVQETGRRYRWGKLELAATSDKIRLIAGLPLEKYVRGIAEVPASWPTEALRAQAVAARTYAADKARRAGHHRDGCDCTLYASTKDQVYVGYEKEDPAVSANARWVSAVDSTAGQVATYQSHPIQAYYSSSSGGRTEASVDVWSTDLPYLRPVDDPWSQRPSNPFAHWEVKLAQEEVASRLGLRRVDSITVKSKTGGGGVREAVVKGNTTQTIGGNTLRSKLGLRSTKFNPGGSAEAIWSSWQRIGSPQLAASSPSVASSSDGQLHAIMTSPQGAPLTARRGPGSGGRWTGWARIGGSSSFGTEPGIVVAPSGAAQAILRGRNGAIYTSRRPAGGAWSSWVRIGSSNSFGREPTIAAGPDGVIWAAIRGQTSSGIYAARRDPTSGWSGWTKVGGDGVKPAIAGLSGSAVLVARASDFAVRYAVYDGGWSNMNQVARGFGKSPVLTSYAGKVLLAARGRSSDRIYATTLGRNGWASWTQVSGDLVAPGAEPSVLIDSLGFFHVFVRGPGDLIYNATKGEGSWAGFFQVGDANDKAASGSTIAPAAVRGRVYVVVRGPSAGMFTSHRAA